MVTSALVLLSAVFALPIGAPKCAINAAAIQAGHGSATDSSLGYGISVKPGQGNMEITITNSLGLKSFKGILMYVNSVDAPLNHLGKFIELDPAMFRSQDKTVCDTAKVVGDPAATFTHANPSDKLLTTVFKWVGTPEEMATPNLVVRAVVATLPATPAGAKQGTPRWMDLPPFKLSAGAAYNASLPAAAGGNPVGVAKVIKCMPKKAY
jgi:hypothetical protein